MPMRTARLRHSVLGVLLLAVSAALLMGWLWLSHLWFAIVTGFAVGLALIALMLRNGWHQTSPESLESRGFSPESDWDSNLMDPGLHREMAPLIPALGRRGISNTPIRRPAAQPAPGSFARRRAPTAWNGQPDRRRRRVRADNPLHVASAW